jgi:hypothetical protein
VQFSEDELYGNKGGAYVAGLALVAPGFSSLKFKEENWERLIKMEILLLIPRN